MQTDPDQRHILIVFSHYQATAILQARQDGSSSVLTSVDLGLSPTEISLLAEGVLLPQGNRLSWKSLEEMAINQNSCFRVTSSGLEEIRKYSDRSDRFYSLMPTASAPTMLISGIPMHRIKGTDPYQDTISKIKVLKPIGGQVLDTATGLGYTAIEAAKTAARVITIDVEPVTQEIARSNPWSQALFGNPRIKQLIGDSLEEIRKFDGGVFSCIIHDPPMIALAGELYSGEFYREAHRVLKANGRIFHYVGDPESESGNRTTRGVIRRLKEAGFNQVIKKPQAFGVVAYK